MEKAIQVKDLRKEILSWQQQKFTAGSRGYQGFAR